MPKPDVSIVIPVYNAEKYIVECLESVVKQTLRNIEVICVYDASTDASREIIKRYCREYPFIKMIDNQCNEGLASARNCGMGVASARYLYFLDADDAIIPEAMEKLIEAADRYNVELVMFDSDARDLDSLGKLDYKWHSPELDGRFLLVKKCLFTWSAKGVGQILYGGSYGARIFLSRMDLPLNQG